MNENTENLVLEHLRAIRQSIGNIEQDMADIKFRMSKLENRIAALERGQADIHEILAHQALKQDRQDDRLARIEKRLDLVDH
ncbi:MAG: hypothetical protein L3J67_11345 [Hyphomicrobiaceae bacterium]|nr:hypothetical protein [Hyphomicrobiaceae bacterium]